MLTARSICHMCSLQYLRSFEHVPKKLAQVDSSGALIVGGYSRSSELDNHNNAGAADVMVMKFSSAGAHQWTEIHGGSGDEFAFSLKAGRAGLFVVHVPTHLLRKPCMD